MPDVLAFAGMIQSFQAITNITKALIGMRDAAMIEGKVIELQGEILSAQASAFAAQADHAASISRISALEKEVAHLKAWDAEKQKYHLVELRTNVAPGHGGALAYALKEQTKSSEPIHFLCPNCYEDGRKAILQQEWRPGRVDILYCLSCHGEINRTGEASQRTISPAPLRKSRT
jgi:hypothetical protein